MADALRVSVEFLVKGTESALKQRELDTLNRKIAAKNIKKMAAAIDKNAGVLG